ncbi:hypothetical protein A3F62_00605 [Candidatus Woesebacteria bacterium RIFCSPHIGHO2_12_FULL_44_11]|nr:MAG: hypothetical protein A3F62_00605 [Candidatus Woesebacteria bacterium RIFCSPHIGHO2_12_FULL_44_11]
MAVAATVALGVAIGVIVAVGVAVGVAVALGAGETLALGVGVAPAIVNERLHPDGVSVSLSSSGLQVPPPSPSG